MDSGLQQRSKLILLILAVCLVLLQAGAISQRSFWEDETVTASLGPQNFGTIVRARAANNHPPLYWLSAAAWGRLFGYGEWSLKSYSLLWLLAVFSLLYKFTGLHYGELAALIAITLFVFSPYVLTYGHNARYYAMSAALSLFLAWMAANYLRHGRWKYLLMYVIASVALVYTLYMGATLLIALNLWYLVAAIKNKAPFRNVAGWLLAQLAVVASYLPWLSILIAAAGRNLDQSPAIGNIGLELLTRFGYVGYAYLNGEFLSPLNPLVWLLILLFILLSVYSAGKVLKNDWLPVAVIFTCLTLSVVTNLISVYPQSAWQNLSNRTFFVFPFFVIWLAAILANLRMKIKYLSLGIILFVYMVGIFNYFTDSQMVKPLLAVPWREMMQEIQAQKTPDSVVLCSGGDVACTFYLRLYDMDVSDPWNRERIINQPPVDLWWIQINLGAPNVNAILPSDFVDQLDQIYQQVSVMNYAPQDRSIRLIKSDLFHQVDYEFRVSVYHFSDPFQP